LKSSNDKVDVKVVDAEVERAIANGRNKVEPMQARSIRSKSSICHVASLQGIPS
jgi:hypothetical protein